MKQKIAAN